MTNGNKNTVTFRDVYELVDDRTSKIDAKMQHLSERFDSLESGRLSSLEAKFSELKTNQAIGNAKLMLIWGLIILAINVLASVVLRKVSP